MKISAIKINLLGQTGIIFRVVSAKGEVLQAFSTKSEAESWMASK